MGRVGQQGSRYLGLEVEWHGKRADASMREGRADQTWVA